VKNPDGSFATNLDGSRATVNWLSHETMLPAALNTARICTYDWASASYKDITIDTMLGRANALFKAIHDLRQEV
jgi:hypothetical protein